MSGGPTTGTAKAQVRPETDGAGFAVYVHWPFCLAKCPYCDFNSHVRHARIDEPAYVEAFRLALACQADIAPGRTVGSIFFGGGTPSLMAPATVAAIIEAIGNHWRIAPDAEITLEANPTSVEADRFRGYRAAGVNRVSLGIQALNDSDLKALGRMHSVAEALAALTVAKATFERVTFDLIYARPHQDIAEWRHELGEALAHAAGHLSLYQLTIEPGTTFEALHRAGRLAIPDPELGRTFYDVTQEICGMAGMPAYEVSNHARPGNESRHNLTYWRYGEYVGVGPGAHARLLSTRGRLAIASLRQPEAWLAAVHDGKGGIDSAELLAAEEQGDEFLLMGLRIAEGVDPARYERLAGRPLDAARIAALVEGGLLKRLTDGNLAVTPDGFPILDAVVADLAA